MTSSKTAVGFAAAAALIALSGASISTPALAKAASAKAPCYGVNSSKGQNNCKGQGFKDLTAKQCKAKGGSLRASV